MSRKKDLERSRLFNSYLDDYRLIERTETYEDDELVDVEEEEVENKKFGFNIGIRMPKDPYEKGPEHKMGGFGGIFGGGKKDVLSKKKGPFQ